MVETVSVSQSEHQKNKQQVESLSGPQRSNTAAGLARWSSLAGVLGVTTLLAAAFALPSACIIPDRGIVVHDNQAQEWCVNITGVIVNGNPISNFDSCQCYNRDDSAIIDDQQDLASPSTAFEALRARLVAVALGDCDEEAGQVEPNNCILRTDFDSTLMTPIGGPGDCDAERAYEDDTDGNIGTGVATDDLPDPSTVITDLGNNNYEIDADFFQEMIDDPAQLTRDGARLEPRPSPQSYFRFTNVNSGSVAYELGFRSGDTLATINGYYLQDLDEALTAFTAVKDLASWTVKIKRGPTFIYLNYDLL